MSIRKSSITAETNKAKWLKDQSRQNREKEEKKKRKRRKKNKRKKANKKEEKKKKKRKQETNIRRGKDEIGGKIPRG